MRRSERKMLLEEAQQELSISRRRSGKVRSLVEKAGVNARVLRERREENGFAASLRLIFEGSGRAGV